MTTLGGVRTVGIKVLEKDPARYVRLASHGETVLICVRGQAIAEFGPTRSTAVGCVPDAMFEELVRRGVVTAAILPTVRRPTVPVPTSRAADLLSEHAGDRSDR